MNILKILEDIGAGYLVVMLGGFSLILYILWRGMEMYPN